MSAASAKPKFDFNQYKPLLLKIAKWGGILFAVGIISGIGFYLSILWGYFGELPEIDELKAIENPIASEVYASDGKLLGKYYLENRVNVRYKDISAHVIQALVATEDERFFKRKNAVDARSIVRVLVKTILMQDRSSGGGSTLSQQLIKNLFPRKYDYGILSIPIIKIKEGIIANRLSKAYGRDKEAIITMYLNTVAFGERVYGIEAAASRFFSTTAKNLDKHEAATLIGMLKAPTAYSPRRNPERSKERRNTVFNQMLRVGYLTESQAAELKKKELGLKYRRESHSDGLAPYFREHLRNELRDWVKTTTNEATGKPYNLYTDGLKIQTTIDSRLQTYAEDAVQEHLSQLQADFYKHWKDKHPWGDDFSIITKAKEQSERYRRLVNAGKGKAVINKAFNTPTEMTVFTWKGDVDTTMTPLDSLIHYQYFLNTGFMVMEPATGDVKAWVGGINHHYFKYDYTKAKRQVGSTFKPIVYSTALENGIQPCEYWRNELRTYIDEYDNRWTPRNSDNKYGGYYSMKGALMKSMNTISAQVIYAATVDSVIQLAQKMGIESELPPYPSLALGTPDLSLQEMLSVYSTFANKGYSTKPVYLVEVQDKNGKTIQKFRKKIDKTPVIEQETAEIMTKMLQTVVDSGTAVRLRWRYKLPNDIAGKTGTTQDHKNGWFMAFTPKLVAGVVTGAADQRVHFRTINYGQGANLALPVFGLFMQKMNEDYQFRHLSNATFTALPDSLATLVNCPNFKEYLNTSPVVVDNNTNDGNTSGGGGVKPVPGGGTTNGGATTTKPPQSKPKVKIIKGRSTTKPKKKEKKKKGWLKKLFEKDN